MVWGGISMNGKKTLVIVPGRLNGQRYIDEIITPHVIPYMHNLGPGSTFQDDNARPHRARIVNDLLQQQNINRFDWPAYSPDLNPIENFWDQLGRAVYARVHEDMTLPQLEQVLLQEWNNIPQARVQRVINSMHRRCESCIAAAGGHTHY